MEAARQKAAMVKLESQEKQAEVIQAAIDEGLAASLAEVIIIDDEDPPRTAQVSPPSSAAPSSSSAVGDLSQILGGQRVTFSTPSEDQKFENGFQDYLKFKVKFGSEVLSIQGLANADKFVQLQERTKGEAKKIVENFIYLDDKSAALAKALDELNFFFGKRVGSPQANLTKITEGKEVSSTSAESIKELLQEIQSMVSFAQASKDDSFLSLDASVLSILKKRFNHAMKRDFSKASNKAEDRGEKVDVHFLIKFLKELFSTLNRTYGMSALLDSKLSPPPASFCIFLPLSVSLSV